MINHRLRSVIFFTFVAIVLAFSHPVFCVQQVPDDQYSITVTARSGGKIIAPDGTEIVGPSTEVLVFDKNSSAEFRFEPDTSKYLSDVVLDSFSLGPLDEKSYRFTSIADNHEIIGVFSNSDITIPESAGDDQIYTSNVQLSQSFRDLINKGLSYAAPVVSADGANRAQSGNSVYMTSFMPTDNGQWHGNLKKYGLAYLERRECAGRDMPEWTVVDKNGDIAVDCDGAFLESSVSYWSNSTDGGFADRGGAGQILLDSLIEINSSTTVNQYHSFRNIKTYLGDATGSLVRFNRTNITKDDLEVGDDITRDKTINYIYGYSYGSDLDGRPVAKRVWVLGDIIHSEPKIIDYIDPESGNLQYRYIAVGANDGMIHVFTDTTVVFGGKTYSPGEEIFAFIPTDLLPKLNGMATSSKHTHMVDGSPNIFSTADTNGNLHKTLVFGERRGGRSYWALDITNPDPATWSVKWHIIGGAGSITTPLTQRIEELGYTWNKPFFTAIKISDAVNKNVMIFAGGYDAPKEDGFPEAFIDSNLNGGWDHGEIHGVTVGGTEGYDKYNPGMDDMGRGIFVVDMDDGSLLFNATYGDGTEKTTGISQTYNAMKYCFPADISIIPFSDSSLLMYAADIYGRIWKIKYDYKADTINAYDSDFSTRWTLKRIFVSNPGSSLAPGIGSGLISPFTDSDPNTPDFNVADQGRKTFYSPEVSYLGNEWTDKPVLYFGTGDRAHSRYTMISDRFYEVEDTDSLVYETDLVNLTCNELDTNADADNDGTTDDISEDNAVRNGIKALFFDKKVNGFYRIMDKQGTCKDSSTDHTGEHILSQPTLFAGIIYFTSYQPVLGDPSNPTGNTFIYAIDYSFGTSALNYMPANSAKENTRILEDTFFKINDSFIPSGTNIITRGGNASGLISTGGKLSGIGEDQSTSISKPSGGIYQMLWEVE